MRAVRRSGSTSAPRIRERSITIPSSQVESPGMLWPPQRTAISELLLAGEAERLDDVVDVDGPHDERGAAVGHPVPDRASRVVPGVVREDDLAGEPLAE